jgi:hypothetical protein
VFKNHGMTTSGIEKLSTELDGSLLDRPDFAPFNPWFTVRPAAVVAAADTADIAAAVAWAARRGLRVAVMATGHGLNAPVEDGVLITTHRMDRASVDPDARTATVQAGATWAQVIQAAAPHGLAPINGSSSGVGAVGYTLGGGSGPLSRAYGFAADHVRSASVVDGTGAVGEVDAASDADLFWALRGGKGNFGIVTELQIELMPVAALYGGSVFYPGAAASDVLHAFAEWSADLPERVSTTSVALLRLPPQPQLPEPIRGQFVVPVRYRPPRRSRGRGRPVRADAGHRAPPHRRRPRDPLRGGRLHSSGPDRPAPVLGRRRLPVRPAARRCLRPPRRRRSRPRHSHPHGRGRAAGRRYGPPGRDPQRRLRPGRRLLPDGRRPHGRRRRAGRTRNHRPHRDLGRPWRTGHDLFNLIGPATAARVAALWNPADRARLLDIKRRVDPAGLFGAAHTIV